jgi:hypothetical protein
MMWKDSPPFRGAIVRGVGEEQTVELLEWRDTVVEVLVDLKPFRSHGLDFIRNANGFSILPSKVTPPPEPKRK